jgi:ribA/ribD-fused uncharacterized protein
MPAQQIGEFAGQYRFLSNFWICDTQYGGVIYPSAEHAYQAAKTLDFKQREAIRVAMSPGVAKRMGKHVTIRGDWNHIRVNTMRGIVRDKFTRNVNLGAQLLLTGDTVLVEGNKWHDNFWGICGCSQCQEQFWIDHNSKVDGNWLGRILMEIRTELR